MRASRAMLRHEHGGMSYSQLMFDIAELQLRGGRDGWRIEGEGWFGGDINRLLVRFEGEGDLGRAAEQVELQAVYSRAIGPYFNLQAGLRHDVRPDPSRTHAVFGVEGLAPYWFEIEALGFLSTKGELTGRFAASYDQRLTQRLVLQPRVELNLAAAAIPERGIAAGLSDGEFDLRLRYEIAREFAPYLGVSFGRRFGRFARAAGEGGTETSVVIGLRSWF
ncbi:copper resistance protein B [Sphingomonas changnyeongensis]|uniref:copper resistance protein B n=1 Tax=Sphingomonas changnyeongensis TaxID=2698679 RepID=UPI00191C54F5|nr:copper resistance protein B [Sphingomonas changnyeongensis]